MTEVTLWASMRNSFSAQGAAQVKARNCIATERGGGNRGDNLSVLTDWKLWEKDVRGLVMWNSIKWCLERGGTYSLIIVRSKNAETNTPNRNYVGKIKLPPMFASVPPSTLSHQLVANLQPAGLAKSMSPLGSSAHKMHVRYALKP